MKRTNKSFWATYRSKKVKKRKTKTTQLTVKEVELTLLAGMFFGLFFFSLSLSIELSSFTLFIASLPPLAISIGILWNVIEGKEND